jgi:DNA-binding Xre family transcriptional regulator
MKLKAFLEMTGTTETALARRARCAQASINRVKNGQGNWSFDLLERICAATNGAVTMSDFARAKDSKRKKRKA